MDGWLRLQGCRVDLTSGAVHGEAKLAELSPTELRLLIWMSEHPGEEVPRERLLREVWGYADSVISRTVDTTMRRLRQKLERDQARPEHLHTVRGVGYRFTPMMSEPSKAASGARVRLPAALTGFIGRAEGLARLDGLLSRRRLITIVGPGGVGKTRLALAAARRQQGFSERLFCDLVTVRDREGLLAALSAALGLPPVSSTDAIRRALQDRGRTLVIFDNAEHILSLLAPLLSELLATVEGLVALATSRQRLSIRGEVVVTLEPMTAADAVALLCERATDAMGRPPDPGDLSLLEELVERLDRLPLAIELAAARLDMLTVGQILAQLDDRFAVLSADWVGVDPRQATMWGAIDWSWSRLSEAEQHALARCALASGSFPAEGFSALQAAAPLAGSNLLIQLRRKSLVQADGGWLRLLDSVRDFALAHHPEQRAAVDLGWSTWLVEAAEERRAAVDGRAPRPALEWLRRIRADLLAVWHRHRESHPALAARALLPIHILLDAQALLDDSRERYLAALKLDLPRALQTRLRIALSELLNWQQDSDAIAHARQALADAEAVGEQALLVRALDAISLRKIDLSERTALAERTLTLARKLSPYLLTKALHGRADIAVRANEPALAQALMEESLRICEAEGLVLQEASCSERLGRLYSRQGRKEDSISLLERAVARHAELGKLGAEGWALNSLGITFLERSQHRIAERYFRQSLQRLRSAGREGTSAVLTNLAAIHHQEYSLDEARSLYTEALVEIVAQGRTFEAALTHSNLGSLELQALDLSRAERHLTTALGMALALDSVWLRSIISASLGALRVYRGEYDAAEHVIDEGVRLSQDNGYPRMAAYNLAQRGALCYARGELEAGLTALNTAAEVIAAQGDRAVRCIVLMRRGATHLALDCAEEGHRDLTDACADPSMSAAADIWRGSEREPDFFEAHLAVKLKAAR